MSRCLCSGQCPGPPLSSLRTFGGSKLGQKVVVAVVVVGYYYLILLILSERLKDPSYSRKATGDFEVLRHKRMQQTISIYGYFFVFRGLYLHPDQIAVV